MDSVPPAPELILRMAPRLSPSSPSILRASRSSTLPISKPYCESTSPSTLGSSFAKSRRTSRSEDNDDISSNEVTQYFKAESSLRNFSAPLGSSQKPGAVVLACASSTSALFESTSKTPPQRINTLMQIFNLL